jgi:hypothetical protein
VGGTRPAAHVVVGIAASWLGSGRFGGRLVEGLSWLRAQQSARQQEVWQKIWLAVRVAAGSAAGLAVVIDCVCCGWLGSEL